MTAREQHIEDATRILTHYMAQAYVGVRFDLDEVRAELRTAVEHIVDAAVERVADPTPPAYVKLQPGERDERD